MLLPIESKVIEFMPAVMHEICSKPVVIQILTAISTRFILNTLLYRIREGSDQTNLSAKKTWQKKRANISHISAIESRNILIPLNFNWLLVVAPAA